MKRFLLFALCIFLTACAPSQEQLGATQTSIAATVIAQITLDAPTSTFTPIPSDTALPTKTTTPTPSHTPTPAHTSTPSKTPTITLTPTNTFTPTPPPGIGDAVECGRYFTVKVTKPIEFRKSAPGGAPDAKAVGQFLVVNLELINNTSSTWEDRLWLDDYEVKGKLNSKTYTYKAHSNSFYWQYFGLAPNLYDDPVPPGLPFKTIVAFDVNPDAKDWVFIFHPDSYSDGKGVCRVEIYLK